jgi:DUF971 family protein
MEPTELNVSKDNGKEIISIIWSDGHKSRYASFDLRSSCPCAMCQGEPGIFGREYQPLKSAIPADVVPEEIDPVGRYGLKIKWSDGHNLGIYTFDYLRKLCSCGECKRVSGP